MSDYVENNNITGEAISELIWQFRDKPNIQKLLTIALNPAQDRENVDFDLLDNRWIDTAFGANLDVIGEIVGEARSIDIDSYTNAFVCDGNYLGKGFADCPIIWGNRIITFQTPVVISSYEVNASGATAPLEWRIWGYNISWDLLDAQYNQTNWGSPETRIFQISNTTAYSQYRFEIIDSNNTSIVAINDFQLINSGNLDLNPLIEYQTLSGLDPNYDTTTTNTTIGCDQISWTFNNPVVANSISIDSEGSIVDKAIEVYGSSDNINWTQLYLSNDTPFWTGTSNFNFNNAEYYQYYRVYLEWVNDNNFVEYNVDLGITAEDLASIATIEDAFNIIGDLTQGGELAGLYQASNGSVFTREDEQYRLAIKARIKINRASGTPEDVLDLLRYLSGNNFAEFWEMNRACNIGVGYGQVFDPSFYTYLKNYTKKIVPIGVKTLWFNTFDPVNGITVGSLDDKVSTSVTGLGDTNDSTIGGTLSVLI